MTTNSKCVKKIFGIELKVLATYIGAFGIFLTIFAILSFYYTRDIRAKMQQAEADVAEIQKEVSGKANKEAVDLQFEHFSETMKQFKTDTQRQIDQISDSNKELGNKLDNFNSTMTQILIELQKDGG